MSAPPSFTKEDFALWNQTTSVFHLPKQLVGKSKVPQLRAELVKTIGEKKVSAVQALPDFKFRVCFSSPSVRCAYDINGLNFRGLTITPFRPMKRLRQFLSIPRLSKCRTNFFMMPWHHTAVSFR